MMACTMKLVLYRGTVEVLMMVYTINLYYIEEQSRPL